ncbi:hypothetical protein [Nonomuraea sp. LPB2021202275-12-8]|uniref:hypothetical protein n=1 Tax=Nonomuraea sp. LPB2021202275-12-8 TaxID=3120159 RepID=UPI00300C8C82
MLSALRRASVVVAAGAALATTLALPAAASQVTAPPPGAPAGERAKERALPMFSTLIPVVENLTARATTTPLLVVR